MTHPWIGKVLMCPGAQGSPVLQGRIICVNEADDRVFIAPLPRKKMNGHMDNYVRSPRVEPATRLAAQLKDRRGVCLVDFELPEHWLWSEAQLNGEAGDGMGERYRRNPKGWSARAKKAYALIEPFVKGRSIESILHDPEFRSWPAKRATKLRKRIVAVRRALNAFLLGMGNQRALLPWYIRSGGRGQQKFSKVDTGRPDIGAVELGLKRSKPHLSSATRKILKLGYRKYLKPGVSLKQALAKTRHNYMAKSVVWDGPNCKVKLKPEAFDITEAMFRYWGTRDSGSLRPREIQRGETVAKKEYLRRMNGFKGRLQTANGTAFVDSTSCDQTLVSAASSLRVLTAPWRTEVMGGAVDYVFGMHVGFESPSATTALLAILSAASDKSAWCAKYGHDIGPRDWYSCTFNTFVLDNGEGKGGLAMRALQDLEATASYGIAYDAINKSPVEAGHRSRQQKIDHRLPGSTMGRRKRRGEPDRAQLACLTFPDYMHELIGEVLYLNNEAHVDPLRLEMYDGLKERTRRGILEWLMAHHYVSSSAVDLTSLTVACLPRLKAVLHGNGVRIFNPCIKEEQLIPELLYRSEWLEKSGYLEQAHRRPRRIEIHLNPSEPDHIYLNLNGLKCLDLVTHDPELHKVCLLDWLLICADSKCVGYLSRAKEIQHEVNKAASIDAKARSGRAKQREEIARAGKAPTKTERQSNRRENTTTEAAGMNGIPRPLPDASTSNLRALSPKGIPPQQINPEAPTFDLGAVLDKAAALYEMEVSR